MHSSSTYLLRLNIDGSFLRVSSNETQACSSLARTFSRYSERMHRNGRAATWRASSRVRSVNMLMGIRVNIWPSMGGEVNIAHYVAVRVKFSSLRI